jgi:Zn-dependent M28 family amino/carboxypeptidase
VILLPRALLIVGALTLAAQSADLSLELVRPAVIQQRLELVPAKLPERRAQLEALFRETGCDGEHLTTLAVPHSKEPDVVCTLPGADADTGVIVVGGHYDKVDVGMGAVDDWSGAALLPSLYQTLKAHPGRHEYRFIAFSGEETGLYGSHAYVKQLSKAERGQVRAMINLECLGLAPPAAWGSRADKRLLKAYIATVHALGEQAVVINVDQFGDDDSHPFLSVGIPVLTMHSLTPDNIGVLHSTRDQLSAIHPQDYYKAYRVATVYLTYLDTAL